MTPSNSTGDRYTVHYTWEEGLERLLRCENAGAWGIGNKRWPAEGWRLVDEKHNMIVFSDDMEPEDATLTRDLATLVDLLNDHTRDL